MSALKRDHLVEKYEPQCMDREAIFDDNTIPFNSFYQVSYDKFPSTNSLKSQFFGNPDFSKYSTFNPYPEQLSHKPSFIQSHENLEFLDQWNFIDSHKPSAEFGPYTIYNPVISGNGNQIYTDQSHQDLLKEIKLAKKNLKEQKKDKCQTLTQTTTSDLLTNQRVEMVMRNKLEQFFETKFDTVRDMLIRRKEYLHDGKHKIKLNWKQIAYECGITEQQAYRYFEKLECQYLDKWTQAELEEIKNELIQLINEKGKFTTKKQILKQLDEKLNLKSYFNKQTKQLTNYLDYELKKAFK